MVILTKLLSFLFLISAGDGDGHKGGSEVLLRDHLRSLGSIQAYHWMTNDIYSLSQTSPSQLNTAALLLEAAKVVSIGPQTTQRCLELLGRVDQEADTHDIPGLVQACVQALDDAAKQTDA